MKKEVRERIQQAIQSYTISMKGHVIPSENDPDDDSVKKLIETLCRLIKDNRLEKTDMDKIRKELNKALPEKLVDCVLKNVNLQLIPYFALLFFQHLSVTKQHFLAETLYKKTIIIGDMDLSTIAEEAGIPLEDIRSCKKTLNTIMDLLTMGNYSEKRAEEEVQSLFGFTSELSHYLVSLMIADKAELRMILLLRHVAEIENRLEPIEDIFRSILDTDESGNQNEG